MAVAPGAERYGQRARALRRAGEFSRALETARSGLVLHPASADLHAEVGEIRLAREEYAWARGSFERSLTLKPGHEGATLGLGRVLLRFGEHEAALDLFDELVIRRLADNADRWLEMARALYNEGMYGHSRDFSMRAVRHCPQSAEIWAALGYAVHRLGDEMQAAVHIRRALKIAPDMYGARVHLAHHLFDQGDREEALREFLKVPVERHEDPVALMRTIQVMGATQGPVPDKSKIEPWRRRLDDLVDHADAIDRLFADVGVGRDLMGTYFDPRQLDLFVKSEPGDQVERRPEGRRGKR